MKKRPVKQQTKAKKGANKSGKKSSKKPGKRVVITAPTAQALRALAEQLGKLISLSGYRSTFSLTTIAKEKQLTKFLPKKTSKKEAFYDFLKNLYKERPRTIKLLVREILPVAIEKRHQRGEPVLEQEALELNSKLLAIGVDLESEILNMNLPKHRPTIVPPPKAIQTMLENYTLHARLLPECKQLFLNGHINESVRKASEKFEKIVQDLSSLHSKQGADLMSHVFNETSPIIKFNNLTTSQEKNKQMGYKFMAMGLMHWWRNNLSHGDEEQLPHHDAIGRLIMLSNLIHELDNRVV